MRWLGILCLFLTCTGIGMHAARQLRTRLAHTQKLSALLGDFSTYIRYQCTPLEELLYQFAEHPNYADFSFLRQVSREFCTEIPPRELWKDAVTADTAVPEQAAEILCTVGNVLGTTDMEGQLAALELHRRRMDALADELKTISDKKGELYRRLGVLLGAMLAVMLI
ncbi:MAG: stage III sporulation protein AB [Oscillospiraceae bacterium]|nr:stage III sporulation protein AB [Oscillospiraceae bacterium]